MEQNRPDSKDIRSSEEFSKCYWYREELSRICKSFTLEYRDTKRRLNYIIEQCFRRNRIERMSEHENRKHTEVIALNTPLLERNFSFSQKFQGCFSALAGVKSFKFATNMATAWRKVRGENDIESTIQDMINIYYGELDYTRYDNSAYQQNQFLKDFCLDKHSNYYSNKLKVVSIPWKEARVFKNGKRYSRKLLIEYADKIKGYCR